MNRLSFSKLGPLVAGLLLSAGMLIPAAARADTLDLSLVGLPASVNAGSGSSFEVVLTDASAPGGSGADIGGFNFTLQTSSPDLTLTGATTTPAATYIFDAGGVDNSFDDNLGLPLPISAGSQELIAADSTYAPSSFTTITGGESFDLGTVFFTTSLSALSETIGIDFIPGIANTFLSDENGNPVDISATQGGTVNIVGAVATPEPSTILLLSLGLGLCFTIRRGLRSA